MKPKALNISTYILLKYFILYVVLMIKNENYFFLKVNNISSGEDLFYYLWLLLSLPILFIILLTAPLYFIFKIKSKKWFMLLISFLFIFEFFIYTTLASSSNYFNGVYNFVIGTLLLFLFFHKSIWTRNR